VLNRQRNRNRHLPARHAQQGVALLVALVLLVAVTLMGVSAMQGTIMQERMSGNQRDVEEAFNVAELALRRGEQALLDSPVDFLGNETLDLDAFETGESNVEGVTGVTGLPHGSSDPLYHIAERGVVCAIGGDIDECDDLYSVTAKGFGRNDTTHVVLQSTFRIPTD